MAEEHSIQIEIPPAWWWEQDTAARLEAERRSPVAVEEVRIALRRVGIWRPGRSAQFVATFRRTDADEAASAGHDRSVGRSDLLVLCGAVGFALLCAVTAANIHPSSAPALPRPSNVAEEEALRFEPVEVAVRDLALVTSAMPNAQVTTIVWSTEAIAVSGQNLDIDGARQSLHTVAPGRQVSELGSSQPAREVAP